MRILFWSVDFFLSYSIVDLHSMFELMFHPILLWNHLHSILARVFESLQRFFSPLNYARLKDMKVYYQLVIFYEIHICLSSLSRGQFKWWHLQTIHPLRLDYQVRYINFFYCFCLLGSQAWLDLWITSNTHIHIVKLGLSWFLKI